MPNQRTSTCVLAASLLAGLTMGACTFTPPPPLPEELAEQQEQAQARRTADKGGAGADAEGQGSAEGQGASAAGEGAVEGDLWGYRKGDLAELGMSPEQMRAYARAQGDPKGGLFTLREAVADLPGSGDLWAEFETTQGTIACRLFEEDTPITVANFVGLARGLRPALEDDQETWSARPYFDGVPFHRVIPGFMIQGGDPTGSGRGRAGYVIPDEFVPDLLHKSPGTLSMANRGPGTGGGQFFITLAPVPHLDGKHTVFGQCEEAGIGVAEKIAATRGVGDRPRTPQIIEHVVITRR